MLAFTVLMRMKLMIRSSIHTTMFGMRVFISSPLTKYQVVIGNPPYIRWKNLETELKDELCRSPLWNKYFNSLCDYLFIFILKSIEQLDEEGELIFICTEYWMNTTNSVTLRDYMCRNGYISDIYHFKEAPLFEGVCASFIVFRFVKSQIGHRDVNLFRYNKVGAPTYEELLSFSCFNVETIPQFSTGKRWLLASQNQQDRLSSFEDHCRKDPTELFSSGDLYRIGQYCDIGNGMVSGLDKAFNVTGLQGLTDDEKNNIITVLKAKNLGAYRYNDISQYFFIQKRISEADFKAHFPHIYEYMIPFREGLESRYDYGKDTPYWEFIFPRSLGLFQRDEKRIFVPCKERISNKDHFRFVLAGTGFYPLQDVTGILKKDICKESIQYLTAYLNNERVYEWLSLNGIVKGYIVEFSEAPIASIPYRPIDWENKQEVELHDKITTAVDNYIATGENKYIEEINNYFNVLFV